MPTDMTITNQTTNQYAFGPYVLPAGIGTGTVQIDTTTNASLYLTNDAFADIVNALYVASPPKISVANAPTPFPRVTGTPQLLHGDGSPEGVVFGPSGSLFMRRDNAGSSSALYAKTTGPSLSTGWGVFAGSSPTPGTTLPTSPVDGQQAVLVDSTSAPTYAWLFQYIGAATKWVFLGGSPAEVEVATSESTASTSYVDLTTAGPYFTIPRAGTYIATVSCAFACGSTAENGFVAVKLGATATADSESAGTGNGSGGNANVMRTSSATMKRTAAASDVWKLQYRTVGGNASSFMRRTLSVVPIAVT